MAIEGDVVLIHVEEQPLGFARIERILPDHKPDWYHVTFLLLQIPLQEVTWILRDVYINGQEFTMGGKPMRIEKVESPQHAERAQVQEKKEKGPETDKGGKGKVISFKDMKK